MSKRSIFILVLLVVCSTCTVSAGYAKNVTVDAQLSPSTFSINEGARLRIIVNGLRKNAEFDVPEIDNIKLHRRGQSSQTSFINGTMSASITYNFIVQALAPGQYSIPPIEIEAGGQKYVTKAVPFEVTAAGTGSATGANQGKSVKEIAFITVSEIGDHYPGEIVPITIKAYFSQNFRVDLNSLPTLKGDGVVMPQLGNEPEQVQEVVGGESFHVLIWKTSLSGIKTGKHSLQFSLDATVLVPQKRRSRSPFSAFGGSMFDDSLFDSFMGNVERKPITAVSPDLIFNVQPLPEDGKPDNFTGAIGNFTMEIGASPRRVEVGEPITLNMTVSGEGNFNRVEAPDFPDSPAWKTYSPTSDYVKDSAEFSRSKSFEQAIVVKEQDVKEIPSLSFSYFDPENKKYVTLTSEPIPLDILPLRGEQQQVTSPGTAVAPASGEDTVQASGQQSEATQEKVTTRFVHLSPVALETGKFSEKIEPLFVKTWFLFLVAGLFLLIVVLLFFHLRRRKNEKHPGLLLEKSRVHQLQHDLLEVAQARDAGDSTLFLANCRKAIQHHIGASRLSSASAMTLADLVATVEEDSPLIRIYSMAEEAVYGGASLTAMEMLTYYDEIKKELEAQG